MLDPRIQSPVHELQRYLEREAHGFADPRSAGVHPRWPDRYDHPRLRPARAGRVHR